MSETLAVLIDHAASEEDAATVGQSIIDALVSEGCILPTPNSSCVLTGEGYPPGPRLNELYSFGENELRYWDMLTNCGVKLLVERYVNFWAFPVFEAAVCPGCNVAHSEGESFFDGLYECVAAFINDGIVPDIHCPACDQRFPGRQWKCTPDVGISYLAIEFWNWPPFSAAGWNTSIPDLIARRTNRSLATSWGRM
jgi:hypothetical protein